MAHTASSGTRSRSEEHKAYPISVRSYVPEVYDRRMQMKML